MTEPRVGQETTVLFYKVEVGGDLELSDQLLMPIMTGSITWPS